MSLKRVELPDHDTPVTATIRNPDETPYLTASPDPLLTKVLSETWPHAEVVG